MRKFSITRTAGTLAFFTCIGDEKNLCGRCKAKFFCYTGEMPTKWIVSWPETLTPLRIDTVLEYSIFGTTDLYLIEYDFKSWAKHNNKDYFLKSWTSRKQQDALGRKDKQLWLSNMSHLTNEEKCAILKEDESS